MKLLFVRHGDPDYESDSLTEKGFREAEFLKDRLTKENVAAVYCSSMGRGLDTAKPTLEKLGIEPIVYDWLSEYNGYIIDPITKQRRSPWDFLPDFWTNEPMLFDNTKWFNHPLMKTGNVRDKYYIVCSEIDNLLKQHGYVREKGYYKVERENNDIVIIFCHFGVECVMLSHILNIPPVLLWQNFMALTSSVTTLVTEERVEGKAGFRCIGFGDISHLYAADEKPSFRGRWCETFSNKNERH